MNKSINAILILMLLSIPVLSLSAFGSKNSGDADGDGIPANAEQLLGTNPYLADTDGDGIPDSTDNSPMDFGSIPADNSTAKMNVTVADARVEDNYRADDHLEITLVNRGSSTVSFTGCYITITDKKSGETERYFVDLGGYSIGAGKKSTLHFDNGTGAGHFPGNVNGLYRTGADGLIFDVSLRSSGFKPLAVQVEKAPGTAEIAD